MSSSPAISAPCTMREAHEGRVPLQPIFFDEHLEGAFAVSMRVACFWRVEGVRLLPLGDLQHPFWVHVEDLCLGIYELLNEPGAGYTVRLRTCPGHPLHARLLCKWPSHHQL